MTQNKKELGYCVPGCSDYVFDDEFWVNTMVTQWDLVCEKSWLKTLAKLLLFTGWNILYLKMTMNNVSPGEQFEKLHFHC